MEKKKKLFIIVASVVILAIIIGLVIVMNSQKEKTSIANDDKISNNNVNKKSNNDIVNKENHQYGTTYEHNSNSGRIIADDEYVYIASTSGIKKIAKDKVGTTYYYSSIEEKIFNASSLYLNLYKEYIYFLNIENNKIYRIDKTGNGRNEIASQIKCFYIIDDYIYYTINDDKYCSGIYRMTIDGNNEELVVDHSISKFYIYGQYLYYIAGSNVFAKSDLNGDNEEIILNDVKDFKIYNSNKIIYEDSVDSNTVYMLNSDNTTTRLSGGNYGGKNAIELKSIILNEKYTLFLPQKDNTFNELYVWTFSNNTNDETHYYTNRNYTLVDFEVVDDNSILGIYNEGALQRVDIKDFMNEEQLEKRIFND